MSLPNSYTLNMLSHITLLLRELNVSLCDTTGRRHLEACTWFLLGEASYTCYLCWFESVSFHCNNLSYEYNSFSESDDPFRESLSLREVLGTLTHLPIRQGLFCLLRGHDITAAHYTPMTLEQSSALKCSYNPGEDGQHRMFNMRCLDMELLYT